MDDAPLMLSVSGMRGLVGSSLTPRVICRFASAFGAWLIEESDRRTNSPHVVLGRDSRPSGEMFETAAIAGLVAAGCRVTRVGVLSTPGVAIMTKRLSADGGAVVTASHNPTEWNGLKALRHDGVALPTEQMQWIIDRFQQGDVCKVDLDAPVSAQSDPTGSDIHRDVILPHIDAGAIRDARLKAVVDSVHGAGGDETRRLLGALGVELAPLYDEPTGRFPHTPEPARENLGALCAAVVKHRADIGFAQDPDADRLAIVDERGGYIGEEYTLALCALHVLCAGETVVANLSTSRMIDDIANNVGARVLRTPVGEANVAQAMQGADAAIGGEGNGGVIWPKVSYVRDSFVGMALVLEMLALRKKPLGVIVNQIPSYRIVKDKVPASSEVAKHLETVLVRQFKGQPIDSRDGVRVDWEDRWIHVRPSNTEPILRLIAEASSEDEARQMITHVRQVLGI